MKHAGQGVWVLKQVFFKRFVETSIFTIHTTFDLIYIEVRNQHRWRKLLFFVCGLLFFFNLIYVSRDKHLWLQVFY